MIYALAIGSYLVLILLWLADRGLHANGRVRPLLLILVENAHSFAVPFTITVWAYAGLALVVDWQLGGGRIDIGTLMRTQIVLDEAEEILDVLKFPRIVFVSILAALVVWSLFSVPQGLLSRLAGAGATRLHRLARFFSYARTHNKTVSAAVALLTSANLFTFFGPIPGETQVDLHAHLKEFNQAMGSFEQALDDAIKEQISLDLVERALAEIPLPYQDAVKRYVESVRRLGQARDRPLEAFPTRMTDSPVFDPQVMGSLSESKLKDLNTLLDKAVRDRWARSLLAVDAGRQLVHELVPLVFETSDVVDLDRLERINPLFKPIASVVTDSVDDAIKQRLDEVARQARKAVLLSASIPAPGQDAIAHEVVAAVPLRVSRAVARAANKAVPDLNRKTDYNIWEARFRTRPWELRADLTRSIPELNHSDPVLVIKEGARQIVKRPPGRPPMRP